MKQSNDVIVIFDLDDTLYKEIDFVHSAYRYIDRHLADKHKIYNTYNIMDHAYEHGKNPFNAILSDDITIDELLKLYRFHMPEINLDNTTEQTLLLLQSKGYILGLITDGRSISQRNKIKALALDNYIDDENIIISEEFGTDKTDIRNFRYFCEKYPQATQFLYVGDNPRKDFYHPNQLGWKTICIKNNGKNIHPQDIETPANYKSQHNISSIHKLLSILERD